MTPKPLRASPSPCVYCDSPSVSWAIVPVHVNCTNPACDKTHVIGDRRPVCFFHHPFKTEIEIDMEQEQAEKEYQEKIEAKRFLLGPIFSAENGDKTIGEIKAEAYSRFSKKAVDAALEELQEGNFELY